MVIRGDESLAAGSRVGDSDMVTATRYRKGCKPVLKTFSGAMGHYQWRFGPAMHEMLSELQMSC